MSDVNKPVNQKAWFLILPVLLCVAFSAIIPLMTVVNYSVQDIISPERRVFVGTEWFAAVMRDEELHGALWRQLKFSLAVLAVEIPLGIALALSMPAQGWKSSAVLVVVVFRTLRLPPLLGYLIVGVAIGPHALGWITTTDEVQSLAEIGVVFLMFVIGLEFNLPKLRAMRKHVFGLGH